MSACAIACVCAALACARAKADGPIVTTVVDPCVPIDRSQLDRLLGIELGTSADTASSSTGPTHVTVRCVPAGIELSLQDALTQKGMVRVLSRDSFRDASSTRLLALAVAEFVVASWVELRLPQKVKPVPVGPAPSQDAREAATRAAAQRVQPAPDEARTLLGLAGQVQTLSALDGALLGIGLRIVHAPLTFLAFTIGADFAATDIEHALGDIVVRTGSASLVGLLRIELPPVVLLTGPGARFGLAQVAGAGDPMRAEGKYGDGPFGGLLWLTRGELYAIESLALTLDVELGVVTLPVRALAGEGEDVMVAAEIDGAWLALGLGLALEL